MENNNYTPTQKKVLPKKSGSAKCTVDSSVLRPAIVIAAAIIIALILTCVMVIVTKVNAPATNNGLNSPEVPDNSGEKADYPFKQTIENFYPTYADNAVTISEGDTSSKNIALVDLSSNTIIASRQSGKGSVVYPASLTKVMTLIVVYENLKSTAALDEKLTVSEAVANKMAEENSSAYGFKAGDVLTVNELIHAVMLYSDGIACITLAEYISGSETKFVKLMNDKAQEMGLQNTNFMNCTGLHHDYHYSTAQDLAAIMAYAMKNTFCANVITAEAFSIGSHFRPESGNTYKMYNQVTKSLKAAQPTTCKFYGGKTGLTDEAKYCLVSYSKTKDGKEYILVTIGAESATLRNQDHIDILNKYVKAN